MPFLGIDSEGNEMIYEVADDRCECPANCKVKYNIIKLVAGDIEKLTGKKLRPGSEPIKR